MSLPRPALSAWAASGLLALVTLGVFGVLQDYGPEAAIRKFHMALAEHEVAQRESNEALAARDIQEIHYLTYPQSNDPTKLTPSALVLCRFVLTQVVARGAHMQLYAMQRTQNRAAAVVIYQFPDSPPTTMTWILSKNDRVWQIDTGETLQALRAQAP